MREALGAFGFVGRHFPALLLILAPWLAVSIGLAIWPDLFPDAFNAMAAVWGPVIIRIAIPGPFNSLQWFLPLWGSQVIAFAGFATAWQRHFLLQGKPRRGFVAAWMIVAGMLLIYLAAVLISVSLVGLAAESFIPQQRQQQIGVALLALTVAAGVIVGARFSPALVAAAIGDRATTFGKAWAATRRRSGDLGIGLLLAFLPTVLALMVLAGPSASLGTYAGAAIRMLIWMLGVGLAATFVALVHARLTGGRKP